MSQPNWLRNRPKGKMRPKYKQMPYGIWHCNRRSQYSYGDYFGGKYNWITLVQKMSIQLASKCNCYSEFPNHEMATYLFFNNEWAKKCWK